MVDYVASEYNEVYSCGLDHLADFTVAPYLLDDWPWLRAKASMIGVESFDKSNVLRCDNLSTKAALASSKEVLDCIARLRLFSPLGKIVTARKELSLRVTNNTSEFKNSFASKRGDSDIKKALEDLGQALDVLFSTHTGGADPGFSWILPSFSIASLPLFSSLLGFFSSSAGVFMQTRERHGASGLCLVLGLVCFALAMIPFFKSSRRNIMAACFFALSLGGGLFSAKGIGAFLDTQYPILVKQSRAKIDHVFMKESHGGRSRQPSFYVGLTEPVDLGNGESSMIIELSQVGFKSLEGLPLGDLVIVHGIGRTGRPVIFSWRYEKRQLRP